MHFDEFKTIEELVDLSKREFSKRASGNLKSWIPSRQNVYSALRNTFPKRLMDACDRLDNDAWIDVIDLNPSQLIKAAQDYQLSARTAGIDIDIVLTYFLKLPNLGIKIRKKRCNQLINDLSTSRMRLNTVDEHCAINLLNATLRGVSETLYFDDHTIGGDLYGPLVMGKESIVYRRYNRLCPTELYPDFGGFIISGVETICKYDGNCLEIDDLGNISYLDERYVRPKEYYICVHYKDGNSREISNNKDIEDLSNHFLNLIATLMSIYEKSSVKERKYKILEATLFAYKPLFDFAGIDWRPTNDEIAMYWQSDDKENIYNVTEKKRQITDADITKVIDPRVII